MRLAERYVSGLKQAYLKRGFAQYWYRFEDAKVGATKAEIALLKRAFPLMPQSLIDLLLFTNGTPKIEVENRRQDFGLFGAPFISSQQDYDCFFYGAYLNSCQEMLNNQLVDNMKAYISGEYLPPWGSDIGDNITAHAQQLSWLYFAGSWENPEPASLFMGFSPSETGKIGQLVAHFYYGEEIRVFAESLDDYLQYLMEADYPFVDESSLLYTNN